MPTATVAVTATTTHQLVIAPQIKRKLLLALRTYVELAAQAKVLKLAKKKQTKIVEAIQVELGETSLDIEGFKATLVAPVPKKLDRKLFVALGGNLELLDAAMVDNPSEPYVKITAPGVADDDD